MLRSAFCVSCVIASLALTALYEASVVQAGPASGAQSSRYRGNGSYSYSAPAVVAPASNGEPFLYSYYAPPTRTAAAGEEESESGQAAAKIDLTVPASAEVWFDGKLTHQTGGGRTFDTPPLERGKTFTYDLRVRWTAPGGIVVDVTRPIQVRAGRQTVVGFQQ